MSDTYEALYNKAVKQVVDSEERVAALESEAAALRADLTRVTGERDAAIEYNREVDAQFPGINNALDAAGVTTPGGTNYYGRAIEALASERNSAKAEVKRLRGALAWYADKGNHHNFGMCDVLASNVEVDQGERAFAALAQPAPQQEKP